MSVDPLSEVYEWQSVYAFGSNQPVHAKELEGMESANDLSGNNRSWSFSRFLDGAKDAVKGLTDPLSNVGGINVSENIEVGKNLINGNISGALKSTTVYNIGKTIINAVQGDEKAQGSAFVAVVVAVIVHKTAQAGVKTSANASASASESSAARTGSKGGPSSGKSFTPSQKATAKAANAAENQGNVVCESCKTETVPAKKSESGVTPPNNEAQVDHIYPKSQGGNTTPENTQILCRECNIKKSDKIPGK
jgi:HNH endonuclease